MRKNDLIKMLQSLEGNPEVALWNGFVGDYMNIGNLTESLVVKQNFDFYSEMVLTQERGRKKDWSHEMTDEELVKLKSDYKKYIQWQFNNYVTEEDIKEKRYNKKRIVLIEPKARGLSTWDRMGSISY